MRYAETLQGEGRSGKPQVYHANDPEQTALCLTVHKPYGFNDTDGVGKDWVQRLLQWMLVGYSSDSLGSSTGMGAYWSIWLVWGHQSVLAVLHSDKFQRHLWIHGQFLKMGAFQQFAMTTKPSYKRVLVNSLIASMVSPSSLTSNRLVPLSPFP